MKALLSASFRDGEDAFDSLLSLLRSLHGPVGPSALEDVSVDALYLTHEPACERDVAYVAIDFLVEMRKGIAALLGGEAAAQVLNECSGEASRAIWKAFLRRLSKRKVRFTAESFWKTPTDFSYVDRTSRFSTGARLRVEGWSWAQDVIKRALQGSFKLYG